MSLEVGNVLDDWTKEDQTFAERFAELIARDKFKGADYAADVVLARHSAKVLAQEPPGYFERVLAETN